MAKLEELKENICLLPGYTFSQLQLHVAMWMFFSAAKMACYYTIPMSGLYGLELCCCKHQMARLEVSRSIMNTI